VLQAADILIYLSDLVPVGQDQKQHLEMTRDIAGKFNQQFGEVFVLPEPHILDSAAVVTGVDGRKMSKSYGNEIGIFDEGKELKKKIMSIVTDSAPVEAKKIAAESTPFQLLSLVASDDEIAEWRARYEVGGMGYGEVKARLLQLLDGYFAPYRERRRELATSPDYVMDVLREGGARARSVAQEVMHRVREATGLSTTY
jgi:tryptophanyl-tRNA synthetase